MQHFRNPQEATWPVDKPLPALEADGRYVAEQLIKGLTAAPTLDPSSPCILVLVPLLDNFKRLVSQIAKKRSRSHSTIIRSSYGAVLDAFISFASSIWTMEEQATFENCKCAQHSGGLATIVSSNYRRSRGEEIMPLKEIVIQIFVILSDVLRSLAGATIRNGSKLSELPGKRGKWPSSSLRLMPRSAATTQSAFLRWAQLSANPKPICALCLLSFFIPDLASAMNRSETLVPPAVDLFSKYISWLKESNSANLSAALLVIVKDVIAEYHYVFANEWFSSQFNDQRFVKDNAATLVSFYEALCILISLLDRLDFSIVAKESITAKISMIARNVYKCLSSTSSPVALHHSYISFLEGFSDAVDTQAGSLMVGIRHLRFQPRCAEITCVLTPQETGERFKTCSACRAIIYCSKACQTQDWKTHKGVCKTLKLLFSISSEYCNTSTMLTLPTQGMINMFTEQVERAGFTREDMTRATEYVDQHSSCVEEIQKFLSNYDVRAEHSQCQGRRQNKRKVDDL